MGIFDKLLLTHFFLLVWVMGISPQHNNCISQWKQLIRIIIIFFVNLKERLRKLPNYSLNLL